MAHYDPQEAFEILKSRLVDTVKDHFPVEGRKNVLVANKVWVDDNKGIDDIRSQKEARLTGRTWGVPVMAELELRDKETGKVKDRQSVTLATLPKITRRYTYIVGGNEWQTNNLFTLKSGVYTHIKENGELASQWNLAKGYGFNMNFDPKTKKMTMQYGSKGANIPLYPVLKTMGVDDDTIESKWGKDILSANMKDKEEPSLKKFHKRLFGESNVTLDEAKKKLIEEFDKTQLRPESTKITLGKSFEKVNGEALLIGSHKLLKVSRMEEPPDDRDSLEFKDIHATEDLLSARIARKNSKDITRKISNPLDKHNTIRAIIHPDIFGKPIRSFFTSSSLSERPDQMNPMSFILGNRRTTILAKDEGGISSEHQLTMSAKSINPSHMGFLDPIQTPESSRVGTTLQLSLGARKVGHDLQVRAVNAKNGKEEWISPYQASRSNLAFPDQYKTVSGHLIPVGKQVKICDSTGSITKVKPADVDFILRSAKGMFDLGANMIPFVQNSQGNRTMMAAKQVEQAIPLVDREVPLVQVKTDSSKTFEELVGSFVSHHSPVHGTVEKIEKDAVIVHDHQGKRHEVQLYHDFPLNDNKSAITSSPVVKVGDKVAKGQVLADTNYTKHGKLALGKNLLVAYMPFKGYNFEDGIVISETASKKLTSEHLHRESVRAELNVILNKNKFLAETAGVTTKDQAAKLDDDAVIREGSVVSNGDVLIGALKAESITPEQQKLGLFSKKLVKPVKPAEIRWDHEESGVVTKVVKHGKDTTVFVKARAPADIGDKIVGRHANKGIITKVLPDHEMPSLADGSRVEILLNPAGVPTRINLGQVLETAASKIALKTGKPYIVNNFDSTNTDYTRRLQAELKSHGISDTEEVFDPVTKKSYGQVLVGPQYILKLHHTAAKGLSARSRDAYDSNLSPRGGGHHGGQTMDAMGLYALLAHNARENIREFQTVKSEKNDEYWNTLLTGDSLPAPKVPFVFRKFEGYLKGLGVDVVKEGNSLILQPLTDKKTLAMSNGELTDPGRAFQGKNLKPEKGGIFDPKATGNNWPVGDLGTKWSHITLAERMPNPVFEGPIQALLGMNKKTYASVVSGASQYNGQTGPRAIVAELEKLDTVKRRAVLEKQMPTLRSTELNAATRTVKYIKALERADMTPKDAYTMKHLPVLPPNMRPVSILPTGELHLDDLNRIYQKIGAVNEQLKTFPVGMPSEEKIPLHNDLHDALKGLAFTGTISQGKHLNGIVETISGKGSPKLGFFQKRVIGKRQDLSMRGTIVPEPAMSIDEISLPRKAAAEVYKPFVIARLHREGKSFPEAKELIKRNDPAARAALEAEVAERPILLKRDPVLHKFGVQAFKPVLTEGLAVKIHPLVTSGYNADFDGDKMSAYVPVSPKAVQEAYAMMPSHNLFNPASSALIFAPKHETQLGLFKLTEMGRHSGKHFSSASDAAKAGHDGKILATDIITVSDPHKGMEGLHKFSSDTTTTLGRLMVYNSLPPEYRDPKMLTDRKTVLDKGELHKLLTRVAQERPNDYGKVADKLKNMGNEFSTGLSIGLSDFESDHEHRDKILAEAYKVEEKIRAKKLPVEERDAELVKLYTKASDIIQEKAKANLEHKNNRMYDWIKSKARGDWDQFRQMTVAPMIVSDSQGKLVPVPITKSYSEGLDIGSYWTALHGARLGTISRVEGTWKPGLMGKQIMQTTMNQVVVSPDCGTTKGVRMPIEDRDVLGRYTAAEINLGTKGGTHKGIIPAGTQVTTDVLNRLKNNKIDELSVRTPLKCEHGAGLCAKCYGTNEHGKLYQPGFNLGVMAAHALGEPATQLSMRVFHSGGVAGAKGTNASSMFKRVEQLINLPAILPGKAILASSEGKVEKIDKDAAGGWDVFIGGQRHYVPSRSELIVKPGQMVTKGSSISSGPVDPHDLLPLTSLHHVQKYLTDEIWDIYKGEGPVRKRNVETVVRALTNLAVVKDPGSHEFYMRGDHVPTSEVFAYNRKLPKGKEPVKIEPLLKGTTVLPLEVQTDWLARMQSSRLKKTILDAAAEGWKSEIHSTHPIPGMAYGKHFGEGTPDAPHLY
jgi:DNA-directed RNA polymerase subunit beta'